MQNKVGTPKPNGDNNRGIGTVAPAYVSRGCPASDWGAVFLISIGLFVAAYGVGGVAFGARTKGGRWAVEAHPHFRQWLEIRGLCLDGLRFVRAGGRNNSVRSVAHRNYTQAPDGDGGKGKAEDQERGRIIDRKPKKQKRSTDKESNQRGGPAAEEHRPATTAPSPGTLVAAGNRVDSGTTAGGGGRWVHVPN